MGTPGSTQGAARAGGEGRGHTGQSLLDQESTRPQAASVPELELHSV